MAFDLAGVVAASLRVGVTFRPRAENERAKPVSRPPLVGLGVGAAVSDSRVGLLCAGADANFEIASMGSALRERDLLGLGFTLPNVSIAAGVGIPRRSDIEAI